MTKKLKHFCMLGLIFLGLILPGQAAPAADQIVNVALPEFTVKLNGQTVDNQYRRYPMLVYKDITYFPMTWYDCRLLGLETEWTQAGGLRIFRNRVTSAYDSYQTDKKNNVRYQAGIPSYPITVNGTNLDNTGEEYPFLSFNNITYFPLTWRFAHDEFGWDYKWNGETGLSVSSRNPQVETVELPSYAWENDVAYHEGYYYFVETVGNINKVYRKQENKTTQELVYTYEVSTFYGFNNRLTFELRDGQLWFFYHMGGAVMGSDVYCRVNTDGQATIEQSGYLDFIYTPLGTLRINQFEAPYGNNLLLIPVGQEYEAGKSVGDPGLLYGWRRVVTGTSHGYTPSRTTTVVDNYIYVLASSPQEENNVNRVCRIDMNTNETINLTESSVRDFKIINHKLYYVKESDGLLYSAKPDGTEKQRISDQAVAKEQGWYDEIDGLVFYTRESEGGNRLFLALPEKEDEQILPEAVLKVARMKEKIVCQLASGEDYGLKVLDKEGDLFLAVAKEVSDIKVYRDRILMKAADKSIKEIKIR